MRVLNRGRKSDRSNQLSLLDIDAAPDPELGEPLAESTGGKSCAVARPDHSRISSSVQELLPARLTSYVCVRGANDVLEEMRLDRLDYLPLFGEFTKLKDDALSSEVSFAARWIKLIRKYRDERRQLHLPWTLNPIPWLS